ncbi:MAG: ribosome small subunit-dependent GTPase A [candidate division FCPU426 bacterium]
MPDFQAPTALGWSPFFEKQIAPEERHLLAARVAAVHKHRFALVGESGALSAVVAGKTLHMAAAEADLPVVGDWVLAKPPVGGTTVIVRRLERRSELSRRRPLDRNASTASSERQVMASNLDFVFIVMSLNQDLNPARLERALTVVWNSGAVPVVLLSKADICPEADFKAGEIQAVAMGADVHFFSGLQGQGLERITAYFKTGTTACLIGSSGVGKTTLINALCGTRQKTLAIREDDSKGRHATTGRALFFLPGGGMIIDTPGLREIGLMDDADLRASFADIAGWAGNCKYSDCTHQVEPGCAVLAAVADGRIKRERYDSYLKLCRELAFQAGRQSVAGRLEAKKKQKQLGKVIKQYQQENFKRRD